MKKYLITSLVSVTASIILIIYLYRTKDIEWVDAIVERSTALVGIEPEIVTQKIEARAKRQREAPPVEILQIPFDTTTVQPSVAAVDSVQAAIPATKKVKRLFNLNVDSPRAVVALADTAKAKVADPPKKKKQLFNLAVEAPAEPKAGTAQEAKREKLVYFKAEVNERQQFANDEEIVFRTSESVSIGGTQLPARYIFRAKANVFGGRIVFILKRLNDITIDGHNYADEEQGMPVATVSRLGSKYLVSDGFPVVFGFHL